MPKIRPPNPTPASVFASHQDLLGSDREPWSVSGPRSTLAWRYEAAHVLGHAGDNRTGSDTMLGGWNSADQVR